MRCAALLLALVCCSAPASAQDQISPDMFLDLLTGKTATFTDNRRGTLVGIEEFTSRTSSRWTRANGTCAIGTVFVRQAFVCFTYDDEAPGREHCWIPFLDAGVLLVMSWPGRELQRVTDISTDGVSCTPPPTS